MNITIWSDFACPFCYIGEAHLEQALEQLNMKDVEIDYLAYELDPNMPKDAVETAPEHFANAFGISMDQAKAQVEKIAQMGRAVGIDFRYADSKYCNTFDAHRLVKFADATDIEKVSPLVHALFAAFFTEGKVLSDHKVLEEIAAGVGLDADKVREVLEGDRFADDVRANEREAHMQGVRGVPYMILGGEIAVPGALPVEDFVNALKQVQEKEQAKAASPRAHVCGPDGCQLL